VWISQYAPAGGNDKRGQHTITIRLDFETNSCLGAFRGAAMSHSRSEVVTPLKRRTVTRRGRPSLPS